MVVLAAERVGCATFGSGRSDVDAAGNGCKGTPGAKGEDTLRIGSPNSDVLLIRTDAPPMSKRGLNSGWYGGGATAAVSGKMPACVGETAVTRFGMYGGGRDVDTGKGGGAFTTVSTGLLRATFEPGGRGPGGGSPSDSLCEGDDEEVKYPFSRCAAATPALLAMSIASQGLSSSLERSLWASCCSKCRLSSMADIGGEAPCDLVPGCCRCSGDTVRTPAVAAIAAPSAGFAEAAISCLAR